METIVSQEKIQKNIKIITWIILVISLFAILASFSGLIGSMFMNAASTKIDSYAENPPIHVNYISSLIMNSIQFLLSAFLLISAIFTLQFKEAWRRKIILALILSIAYLLIAPVINYYYSPVNFSNKDFQNTINNSKILMLVSSYFYSVIISAFFIISIFRYSNKNIKILFN